MFDARYLPVSPKPSLKATFSGGPIGKKRHHRERQLPEIKNDAEPKNWQLSSKGYSAKLAPQTLFWEARRLGSVVAAEQPRTFLNWVSEWQ